MNNFPLIPLSETIKLVMTLVLYSILGLLTYFYLYFLGKYTRVNYPQKYKELLDIPNSIVAFPFNIKGTQRTVLSVFSVPYVYTGLLRHLSESTNDPILAGKLKVYRFLRTISFFLLFIFVLILFRIL